MPANNSSPKLSSNELRELNQKLDDELNELRTKSGDSSDTAVQTNWAVKTLLYGMMIVAGLAAPFIVLIRTSVFLYTYYHLNGWLALSAGVLTTVMLLLGYALFVAVRYGESWRIRKFVKSAIAVVVAAYTCYGLLYYSGMNTKTGEVRSYYRSLHPIMRVALSTATLADPDLVVTSIQRTSSDYAQMGLPENQQSLHYVQPDGYVHAMDLRTKGRSAWKNGLMYGGLNLIGLQTLRHQGTADHLHVYLPLND